MAAVSPIPSSIRSTDRSPLNGPSVPWHSASHSDIGVEDEPEATVGIMVWPEDSGKLLVTMEDQGFMEETSAVNCGLEEGDVLTAVDGNNITHLPAADASHLLSGKFNSQVRVEVQRGEGSSAKIISVVVLRDVPIDVAVEINADIGVTIWPDPNGAVVITGIKEGTSAFNSGLATGDVIVMIDELSVVDIHAGRVAKMLKGAAGSDVMLTVSRIVDGLATTVMLTVTRDVYIESLRGVVTEGGIMVLTREQKALEDELFGPFAGMKIAELPPADKMWDMMHNHMKCYVLVPKIGPGPFTQFVHWLAMQHLSLLFADDTKVTSLLDVVLKLQFSDGEQVVTKEAAFEFFAQMTDAFVPALCADVFRVLDHNDDGELSAEEWAKMVDILRTSPDSSASSDASLQPQVVDFIFTIIDKDKSGTLDAEELGDVARKVFGLALDVLEAALKCVANSAHEAATKDVVEDIFAALDDDEDGTVTVEELLMGIPPCLVTVLVNLPPMLRRLSSQDADADADAVATLKAKASTLTLKVMRAVLGAWSVREPTVPRHVFVDKMKRSVIVEVPDVISAAIETMLPMPPHVLEDLREEIDGGLVEDEAAKLAHATFDLLDQDNDGLVSLAHMRLYSDLLLEPCPSESEAKERVRRLYASLDVEGNGGLTKGEVEVYVSRVWEVIHAAAMLGLRALRKVSAQIVPSTAMQVWRGYSNFRREHGTAGSGNKGAQEEGQKLLKLDAGEFSHMCATWSKWWRSHALPCLKERDALIHSASESLWSTIFNDLVAVPGEDLVHLVSSKPSKTGPVTCPADHTLCEMRTPDEGWGCDLCPTDDMPCNTLVYGCQTCRWVCCAPCYGPVSGSNAHPPGLSEEEEGGSAGGGEVGATGGAPGSEADDMRALTDLPLNTSTPAPVAAKGTAVSPVPRLALPPRQAEEAREASALRGAQLDHRQAQARNELLQASPPPASLLSHTPTAAAASPDAGERIEGEGDAGHGGNRGGSKERERERQKEEEMTAAADRLEAEAVARLRRSREEARKREETMDAKEAEIHRREQEMAKRELEVSRAAERTRQEEAAAAARLEAQAQAVALKLREQEVQEAIRKREEERQAAAIRRREEEIKEAMRNAKQREEEAKKKEIELQERAAKEMALFQQQMEEEKQKAAAERERERETLVISKQPALVPVAARPQPESSPQARPQQPVPGLAGAGGRRGLEVGIGMGVVVVAVLAALFAILSSEGCVAMRCEHGVSYLGTPDALLPKNTFSSLFGVRKGKYDKAKLLGVFDAPWQCEQACVRMNGRARRAVELQESKRRDEAGGGGKPEEGAHVWAASMAGVSLKYRREVQEPETCLGFTYFARNGNVSGVADGQDAISSKTGSNHGRPPKDPFAHIDGHCYAKLEAGVEGLVRDVFARPNFHHPDGFAAAISGSPSSGKTMWVRLYGLAALEEDEALFVWANSLASSLFRLCRI